jgi:hypothetical protein
MQNGLSPHVLFQRIKALSLGIVVLIFAGIAAWFTHVFTCLANGEWGFLIAGALAFPIAIVHGIGIWFGFW